MRSWKTWAVAILLSVACQKPVPVESAQEPILGALDKSIIDEVIKSGLGPIKYCYEQGLKTDPDLSGSLRVKFVISKTGSVSKAELKDGTIGDQSVVDCVVSKIEPLVFPPPKGGGIVIVTYPFHFNPK